MAETRLREHCLDTPARFYTFNPICCTLGLTANALAKAIGVPPNRSRHSEMKRSQGTRRSGLVTFFKTTVEFWMNLQNDLRLA